METSYVSTGPSRSGVVVAAVVAAWNFEAHAWLGCKGTSVRTYLHILRLQGLSFWAAVAGIVEREVGVKKNFKNE